MDRISPGIRRLLALSLLILPPMVFIFYIALPLSESYTAAREEIAQKRVLLFKYKKAAKEAQMVQLQNTKQARDLKPEHFMQGENEDIAAANLQSRLKQIAATYGLSVASARALGKPTSVYPNSFPDVAFIGISLDLNGTHETLKNFLYEVEQSSPYLIVFNSDFSASPGGQKPDAYTETPLNARLDIYGLLWKGGKQ